MSEIRAITRTKVAPLRKSVLIGNLTKNTEENGDDAFLSRRKSIVLSTTPTFDGSFMETSNDEKERSGRRSIAEVGKMMSSSSPGQSPLNKTPKFIGKKEMKDHFQICTKLHAENKINTKNAWTLQIIDLVRLSTKETSSDTLRMAGTSLDISAKVYSVRVDDIHSEGLKLASSLARASQKEALRENGDNSDDANDSQVQGDKKTKRTKRKTVRVDGVKHTIAKDPKSLIEKPKKLESVFFSTRINSELSTIENLVTNRMPMNTSGYKFVTVSTERFWATGNEKPDQKLEQEIEIDVESIPNEGNICAAFTEFDLINWNPDAEGQFSIEKSIYDQPDDDVLLDDDGQPIYELDGSILNTFDDNKGNIDNLMDLGDEEVEEQEEVHAQFHREIAQVADLRSYKDECTISEYSYNSVISTHTGQVVDQIWAGPSYWKLKFLRRNTSKFTGSAVVTNALKTKRKNKIVDGPIDFFEVVDFDEEKVAAKARKRLATTNNNKYTLPLPNQSLTDTLKMIKELCVKPGTIPVLKDHRAKEPEIDVPAYKYENLNDSQYCSQFPPPEENDVIEGQDLGTDDLGCADNTDLNEEEIAVAAQHNFLAENLVDVPTDLIQKGYIPYALQPKKMDMKKLKAAIWNCITEKNETAKVKVIPFSKLYAELPQTLPSIMQKELSCSLAFVALLHLCNEQNLQLDQHPNYQDFTIRK